MVVVIPTKIAKKITFGLIKLFENFSLKMKKKNKVEINIKNSNMPITIYGSFPRKIKEYIAKP